MTSRLPHGFDSRLTAGAPAIALASPMRLTDEQKEETLNFLAVRPIHSAFMAGLISDNGIASPFNRGDFYGCRHRNGNLEGVALIGHATMFETESPECIETFALMTRSCSHTRIIRGEQEKVESFWNHYSAGSDAPLICREFLLSRQALMTNFDSVPGLRLATLEDLDLIVTVNACLALQESGTNPLTKDSAGFRQRTARRIGQGRCWILTENSQLIFKTDIAAQTPQAVYLEGVYVDPDQRGKGYGFRCLSQLSEHLLKQVGFICLTVNENFPAGLNFYKRVGFDIASRYDTIYLDR